MAPEALEAGTWSFPRDGGEPVQLAAATPPTQDAGTYYMPIEWSPDGQKLLLRTTLNNGPDGPGGDVGTIGLALFDRQSGEVRQLLPDS